MKLNKLICLLTGLAFEFYLLANLVFGNYEDFYLLIWIVGIILILLSFIGKIKIYFPKSILSVILFPFLITVIFLIVNLSDLTYWYFSAINDEYAFFHFARSMAQGASVNIFSQNGVYGLVPVLSSYYQGTMMKVLGIDNFGWKASIILLIAASFLPFYFFVKSKFGKIVACSSLSVLAFSYYLWAYNHTGYSNIEPIALTIFAIYYFFRGLDKKSHANIFLAGVFSGLGFYTFFSSRITIVILFVFLAITSKKNSIKEAFVPLTLGFLVTFLPIGITAKSELITKMIERSVANPFGTNLSGISLIANNLWRSVLGFFWAGNFGPYTSGPHITGALIDKVSAVLFLLGFTLSLINLKVDKYKFLVIWFILALITVGGMSQYAWTNVSRLHYLLPIISIFAGIGFDKISQEIFRTRLTDKVRVVLTLSFATLILFINLYIFRVFIPNNKPMTNEALAVKELRFGECKKTETSKVVVIDKDGYYSTVAQALDSYPLPIPVFLNYNQGNLLTNNINDYSCIIFVHPEDIEANSLITLLINKFTDSNLLTKFDPSRSTSVAVITRKF